MKKTLVLLMAVAMTVVVFAGCGSKNNDASVKTGFAVISSIAKSKDVANGTGLAEVDSTAVAVTVDKDGKIVKCVIDAVQSKINFSDVGKITTPLTTTFKSKNELGTDYGMKKSSKIGKEWNEEAAAFAKYAQGKTVSQLKGLAVNDEGAPTASELTSSVTISVGDFVKAIEKAVGTASDRGAKASDKLGMGIVTNMAKSTDATADKAGVAQAYSTYTVTTTDSNGKITSCVIDASQSNVNFSAVGKITSDLTAALKSKDELGTAYGMKKSSKIGKEWNEEADSFAKYVVGKTSSEVKGVAVNSEGAPTASELTSSVTISVGDFVDGIQKAVSSAK